MTPDRQQSVWGPHAGGWSRLGSPLRPSADDSRLMLALAEPALLAGSGDLAVLGMTPEIVGSRWPAHVRLHALDHSADMIANVWHANPDIWSAATRARWQALPLASRSVDAVVGDGSLNALAEPADYAAVIGEIARVLRPGGALVLRCYIRPDCAEPPEAVADAAMAGRVGSFHVLKWRVAMALPGDGFDVPVTAIRESFDRLFPDRALLARATGWLPETIATIDTYRGAATRYSFPSLDAFARVCSPLFAIARTEHGGYELADRCPTLLLRPSAAA